MIHETAWGCQIWSDMVYYVLFNSEILIQTIPTMDDRKNYTIDQTVIGGMGLKSPTGNGSYFTTVGWITKDVSGMRIMQQSPLQQWSNPRRNHGSHDNPNRSWETIRNPISKN